MNTTIETLGDITLTTIGAYDHAGGMSYRREQRHATREAASVDLEITMPVRGESFSVRWSVNRGAGWSRPWRKSGFTTEAAARAFADRKIAALLAWLAKVEPAAPRGISSDMYTTTA
jgi:hypothetical protein